MNEFKFYAYRNLAYDRVDIYGKTTENAGKIGVISPVLVTETRDGLKHPPFISLDDYSAQILMDTMWEAGIRPAASKSSIGQLDAVQYHLEDMRKLVFNERTGSKSITN